MAITKALEIGETLAYPTPDGRFVIALQRTQFTWTVTTEQGTLRIAELSRTFATEDTARLFAREVSKRLKDGATVDEVVAAIQPAAELITAVTAHLTLAAFVDALSPAAKRAILADPGRHIARGNGVSVSTLSSLAPRLGDQTYRTVGRRKVVTGLDLNDYGLRVQAYLIANRTHAHAA